MTVKNKTEKDSLAWYFIFSVLTPLFQSIVQLQITHTYYKQYLIILLTSKIFGVLIE